MKKFLAMTTAAIVALSGAASADKLADIKEAGKLVVGVKQDYAPWGYLDSDGNLVGLEIDLAKDAAARLGVEVELVPVVASNRMEFLQQGQIDLIIATMGDNDKRRKVVGMIEPNYYAGGANVIAPAGTLNEWADLDGQKVCAVQGAYYNKPAAQGYNAEIAAFAGVPEATAALQNGACVAFLYDNTWIESQLSSNPQWDGYEMPMETENPSVWAIAVPLEDLDAPFGETMREIVADWHKSGFLIARNMANGIANSPFLVEQHNAQQ
ncbi:transporter substrate-binding domain-containing protein [Cognatishimia activa]|uniref:ABC transporter glutamine-binding protein GlnH n=1 Tax=Cognatishimia activa TaxID=1715691 RepID=A0A0P1IMH5_9RHOB|nr:transporter substrate-binding domain-containing protein [Cognatishimia activa]CUI32510.1 ABC transporter glutamine-binding protein GlnH precursor [Cognatishimia activa]CUK24806.1 ABC transporter glutamine-binding protein GlnH precursor [Cognatishimia activa]